MYYLAVLAEQPHCERATIKLIPLFQVIFGYTIFNVNTKCPCIWEGIGLYVGPKPRNTEIIFIVCSHSGMYLNP
jgi:hypothetical protein